MIMQKSFIFNKIFKIKEKNSLEELENDANLIYRRETIKVDFNKLKCPKCKSIGNYEIKGYYKRTIIINNYSIRINVMRIKCRDCGRTHAIFFLDFIPYYQLSTLDARKLILNNYCDEQYDYDLLKNLKKRYLIFVKRIILYGIAIKESIINITTKYIVARMNSYLQIHRGIVINNPSS